MKNLKIITLALLLLLSTCATVFAETVVFNWKTLKFHKPSCQWAHRCTVNCTKVDKKEAIRHGGVPCKVCGG